MCSILASGQCESRFPRVRVGSRHLLLADYFFLSKQVRQIIRFSLAGKRIVLLGGHPA